MNAKRFHLGDIVRLQVSKVTQEFSVLRGLITTITIKDVFIVVACPENILYPQKRITVLFVFLL